MHTHVYTQTLRRRKVKKRLRSSTKKRDKRKSKKRKRERYIYIDAGFIINFRDSRLRQPSLQRIGGEVNVPLAAFPPPPRSPFFLSSPAPMSVRQPRALIPPCPSHPWSGAHRVHQVQVSAAASQNSWGGGSRGWLGGELLPRRYIENRSKIRGVAGPKRGETG